MTFAKFRCRRDEDCALLLFGAIPYAIILYCSHTVRYLRRSHRISNGISHKDLIFIPSFPERASMNLNCFQQTFDTDWSITSVDIEKSKLLFVVYISHVERWSIEIDNSPGCFGQPDFMRSGTMSYMYFYVNSEWNIWPMALLLSFLKIVCS